MSPASQKGETFLYNITKLTVIFRKSCGYLKAGSV